MLSLFVLAAAWLAFGRHLSTLLDRFGAVQDKTVPVSRIAVDGTHLILNSRRWILPPDLYFSQDAQSRLILSWKGQSLALARVLRCSGDYYEFTPDSKDQVTLEQSRSLVPWATPFAYSFLGGNPPKWHRYRYHRLLWRRAGGGSVELIWSDRESFYPSSGWMEQYLENIPRFRVNF